MSTFSELPQLQPLFYSKTLPDNFFASHHVGKVKSEFIGFEIFLAFLEGSRKILSCSQNQGCESLGIRSRLMEAVWKLGSRSCLEI